MRATFTRISPAKFAESVGIPAGWFVVSHKIMPAKGERRLAHGAWYCIKGPGGSVYRILRFSPNLRWENPTSEIVIDWQGWLDLNGRAEDVTGPAELEILNVRWWKTPVLAVAHPDPAVRMAGVLGLISIGLGVLSVVLTLAA